MAFRITSRSEYHTLVIALCILHDASVTSGFRTKKRNTAVGGAPRSRHPEACGDDLVPDDNTPKKRRALIADAKKLGMWAKNETTHVHVQAKRADLPD